ncbi:MAG: UDP-N-acetylmuramate dehydrogenase [Chlamydiales bacterium]
MDLPFPHKRGKLLSEVSTFGIGGPARYFAEAKDIDSLRQMILFVKAHSIPYFILGKGSNSLFDDRGFNGLVILNQLDYMHHEAGSFIAGSGYSFARLGQQSAKLGYTGLEFASGIPATVGGALFMNAGANGREVCESLYSVRFMESTGDVVTLRELSFSYRHSPFQGRKGVIVEATFMLQEKKEAKKEQKKLLDYRLQTQPYGQKSCGCVFRNPQGEVAGRLIEECGLKGARVGDICVSNKHANFIVNDGRGTAAEVRQLMEEIKEKVFHEKGIELQEEIRFVPYDI